jgi:hypothetical protein
MAERRQKIRGTTLELDQEIGLEGLLAYDTEENNIRLFDGIVMGGYKILNATQIATLYTLPDRLTETGIPLDGLSANDAEENGWYTTDATTTDLPGGGSLVGSLFVEVSDPGTGARTQVWTRTSDAQQWRRTFDGVATWTAWGYLIDFAYLTTNAGAVSYDAARLGGQLPAYYSDIVARLGYTPANKAGDTFTGAVTMASTLGVTGAVTLTSTLAVNGGVVTITGPNAQVYLKDSTGGSDDFWLIADSDSFHVLTDTADDGTPDSTPLELRNSDSNAYIYGNKAWNQGNDGAGSGLDADLLDGLQGASYALSATNFTAGNGLTGGGTLAAGRDFALGTPGTLSSGTGNSVTADSHTHQVDTGSVVQEGMASRATGDIGTYALLFSEASNVRNPGSTLAGSGLEYSTCNGNTTGTSPSGTWRCMGYSIDSTESRRVTLWMRIS